MIVEITLQPWHSFKPDGLILFSDILTPLNAMGIPFEIDESKGPLIEDPVTQMDDLKSIHTIDFQHVQFVGEALSILRDEVKSSPGKLPFFLLLQESRHLDSMIYIIYIHLTVISVFVFFFLFSRCSCCIGFCGSSMDLGNLRGGRQEHQRLQNHQMPV